MITVCSAGERCNAEEPVNAAKLDGDGSNDSSALGYDVGGEKDSG